VLERECTDILWSMHSHASRRSDFVCFGARRRFALARKSHVGRPLSLVSAVGRIGALECAVHDPDAPGCGLATVWMTRHGDPEPQALFGSG